MNSLTWIRRYAQGLDNHSLLSSDPHSRTNRRRRVFEHGTGKSGRNAQAPPYIVHLIPYSLSFFVLRIDLPARSSSLVPIRPRYFLPANQTAHRHRDSELPLV